MKQILLATAALAALAGCQGQTDNAAAPAAGDVAAGGSAVTPPAGTSWTETAAKTEAGGYVVGNPDAPVKVVEYVSLTCGVCADFAANGIPPLLANYVAKGTVSLEIRNYVRDPIDVTAAIMTRCGGAGPFLQLTEQTLAEQQAIIERAQGLSTEAQTRIGSLPQAQQYAALAGELELDQFYAQRGVGAQRGAACLADPAALAELIEMKRAADERQIPGTPAFLINDELQQVTNWRALEPLVRDAGG